MTKRNHTNQDIFGARRTRESYITAQDIRAWRCRNPECGGVPDAIVVGRILAEHPSDVGFARRLLSAAREIRRTGQDPLWIQVQLVGGVWAYTAHSGLRLMISGRIPASAVGTDAAGVDAALDWVEAAVRENAS